MIRQPEGETSGATHLPSGWAGLARAGWLVAVVLLISLWAIGSYQLLFTPPPQCGQVLCDFVEFSAADVEQLAMLGLPAHATYLGWTGFGVLYSLIFFVLAAWIYRRRSSDWMGLLVGFSLVYTSSVLFTSSDDSLERAFPALSPLLSLVDILGIGAIMLLLLTFPSGRFVRSWTWKVVGLLFLVLEAVPLVLTASSRVETMEAPGPPTIAWLMGVVIMFGVALYTQIYRYRFVSTPQERQQTKWVVFGFAGAFAVVPLWSYIGTSFPPAEPSPSRVIALLIGTPLIHLFSAMLPLSLGISILRYRLFDIDVLINRTIVYTLLSGALVGAYFASVVVLQQVFPAESQVAIVGSTLLIAALFTPLRQRIQQAIDRRFYRQKYDAELILRAFASAARDEVDLDELRHQLLGQVGQAMQPAHLSLSLLVGEEGARRHP